MKYTIACLFIFFSLSLCAKPLKFECNSMSIDSSGHYVKGKSNTGIIQDFAKTAFGVEVFPEPHAASEFIVKIENKACVFGDLVTIKNCSQVVMDLNPSREFKLISESITSFPQRDTFKTEKAHITQLNVFDADFHPIEAGVVTFDSKVKMANFNTDVLNVKLFCIFRR